MEGNAAAKLFSLSKIFLFSVAGERMTFRLRRMAFSSIVRQDLSWFERPENNTGALCSRLSSDAASIQGATGARISVFCQALSTLSSSLIFGLYVCWSVGLVAAAFVPLLIILTVLKVRLLTGRLLNDRKAAENAAQVAVEAIQNVRCVQSLQLETEFYHKYFGALQRSASSSWSHHIHGLVFGLAESLPFFSYIAVMQFGSRLVADEDLGFDNLYKISQGIVVGTLMFSQSIAFAPDYHKALQAAERIFRLLDRRPTIDPLSSDGMKLSTIGPPSVEFSGACFSYPCRSDVQVLKGLSLVFRPGESTGLVGISGCGKSTCLRLIQRNYDCTGGTLRLDGVDVKNLNPTWLRSQIGVVSQEPLLFGCSIRENIAYGDNTEKVPMEKIVDVATKAGIHQFIASLPQGYDTKLGDLGTQLSGGQKQRVAIARALVRDPRILLLDEATSSLDTESEQAVQEALEEACQGRTCIWVAHRLTSLRRMDRIVVLQDGQVAEDGTHAELLSCGGLYHRLYSLQNRHNYVCS